MRDRTITISGLSKTYSATGWRTGWLLAPPDATSAIRKVHDFLTVGAAAPLQEGAAFALGFPDDYYTRLTETYRQKRDTLEAALREVGFRVYPAHGAYYLMTDIAGFGPPGDDLDFALWLTEEVGRATVSGRSFHRHAADARTKIRFCYCKKPETLDTASRLLRSLPGHLTHLG